MIIEGRKVDAIFIKKLNRFVGEVNIGGENTKVHIPNSGRLTELLVPGASVILRESDNPRRKYKYSLIIVERDGVLVSVDSLLPNKLVIDVIRQRDCSLLKSKASKLLSFDWIKPEIQHLSSRFDVGLGHDGYISYYLEIKGVTLVEDKIALFPDAPTKRGARHLRELTDIHIEGKGAGVFFVVQREDAKAFTPNHVMDSDFGGAFKEAANRGVDIFAMNCKVRRDEIIFHDEITVIV